MTRAPSAELATHAVENQPPPMADLDVYENDPLLQSAVASAGAGWAAPKLHALGAQVGARETKALARQANENPPRLRAFDEGGRRLDEVEFHPAYHRLMAMGLEGEVSSIAATAETGGHAAHAALLALMTQADAGVVCPMSMTYAVQAALPEAPDLFARWAPKLASGRYDPRVVPGGEKTGATMGMAMTEKQGGSDVRANTTRAEPAGGDAYVLTGHKWFCSAPMSDAFLTLAQAPGGLTCFFLPRWRPDGARNAIRIMRLKDKLGDRSNASAEIEFEGAHAVRVGEERRGIATIIAMVQGTRLDCMAGSVGLMRAAVAEAAWRCARRTVFQKRLVDQPMMIEVLADLMVEQAAATALTLRIAAAFDAAADDPHEAAFARVATPIGKYWICKRVTPVVAEAMECVGGVGFVEELPLARLYRQAPLNGIWEGSGNVIALDLLRALARDPEAAAALRAELADARAAAPELGPRVDAIEAVLAAPTPERRARALAEDLGVVLQAAALIRFAPSAFAEAYLAGRIAGGAATFGAGPPYADPRGLVVSAAPFAA